MRISSVAALFGFLLAVTSLSAATIDTTTHGNWIGVYGSDGYILTAYDGGGNGHFFAAASSANDRTSLPGYISGYSYSANTSQYVWQTGVDPSLDTRAPQDPADPSGPRNAATSFSGGDYSVTLNVAQAHSFELSVYALDWDNFNGRDITLTVNGDAVQVNNSGAGGAPAGAYNQGEWVSWNISNAPVGPLVIAIHQNAASTSNSVISQIAFTAVPEPASLVLFGLGAVGLFALARRRRSA